jgi:fatty acid desaturase
MSDAVKSKRWEWPTLAVAAAIYAAFAALTLGHEALPWWLLLLAGGYVTAWHGSLQHEAVHGHPTPSAAFNELLVLPSLWLWLPFRIYRQSHRQHHAAPVLTDPLDDPESYYLTRERWAQCGAWQRRFYRFHNTLAGRMFAGPLVAVWSLISAEVRRLAAGNFSHLRAWLIHAAGCALVLVWVLSVCGMTIYEYIVWFAYPGLSLTLLRSFAEHQASNRDAERTVLLESGPLLSLLFLNNNLHAAHHAEPGLAWYRLPERARNRGPGGYEIRGYGRLAARYLLRAKQPVAYPL